MTLRELRYLVALADHLHFGRAASVCHITQSTLSIQLRKLEGYLGHTLIDRQGSRPQLTPIGEQVVTRARRLIREADEILSLTRLRSGPMAGLLTLGMIPTLAPYYLPLVLGTVSSAYPQLRLVIHEGITADLCARLNDGLIDASFLALPTPLAGLAHSKHCTRCEKAMQSLPESLDSDKYDFQVLFDEPFYVALPPKHSVGDQETVSIDDLDHLDLLLLNDGHCLRGQALEVCRRQDESGSDAFDCRATSLETLLHLVAANRGCTLLPAMAAKQASPAHVVVRPLQEGAFRRIGLIWSRLHPRAHEIEALSKTLYAAVPDGTVPSPLFNQF